MAEANQGGGMTLTVEGVAMGCSQSKTNQKWYADVAYWGGSLNAELGDATLAPLFKQGNRVKARVQCKAGRGGAVYPRVYEHVEVIK